MSAFFVGKKRLTSFQIIILGFSGIILLGTVLLMLPVSCRENGHASFLDALFTSTSAVCVTGLVLHDTAEYWSVFGQMVILLLIQIGGMGVITVAASFTIISLFEASLRYHRFRLFAKLSKYLQPTKISSVYSLVFLLPNCADDG